MANESISSSVSIDGWTVNVPDQPAALEAIAAAIRSGTGFTVFTLNLDHLVKLRASKAFREAYRQATFVTADGNPVAGLARRQDPRFVRTTGADLILPLSAMCAEAQLPVFLFGTSPSVLASVEHRLSEHTGGKLNIVESLSPVRNFDPEGKVADEAIARINASGARVCLVALGAPKQEIFAARAVAHGVNAGFVCVGAGLDFLAGYEIRAPELFQKSGIEWLWRLGSNPRRLAVRYSQCALLLARLTIIETLLGSSAKKHIS